VGDLGQAIRGKAAQQPILWVVDNIPEPSVDSPPRSLDYWCPVHKYVTLLCTSRHIVSGVEATLPINELSVAAAVELLTKPEVQRAWLNDAQWETIVKWVGGLPLALRIIHTSLSEGFINANEILARAQGSEPAPVLDAEVEALHEEIAEDYVRGVAEAFHMSYQLLTDYPALRDAAHLLARMSPIAIEEGSIKDLVPMRLLGRLASRGWIQPASTGSGVARQWRMHRVIASYLRSQSPDPSRELATLVNWLMQVYRSDGPWSELIKYLPHTLYVFREIQVWYGEHPGDGSLAVEIGKQLAVWLATHELATEAWGELHYGAALFLEELDRFQELISQLRSAYHNGDADTARGIARMLSAIPSSQQAAELCSELLQDLRTQVRQSAMVPATHLKHTEKIIVDLMDAILVDIDADKLLVAPPLRTPITDYWRGDPLWNLAQSPNARTALEALARNGFYEQAYKALVSALQDATAGRQQLQAIDRLGLYLRVIDTPLPFKAESWGSYDPATQERGEPGTRFQFQTTHTPRPELFEPLTQIVVESTDVKAVERAVLNISVCISGLQALSTTAHALLDSANYERVISLSNTIARQRQNFPNAYWWRGLALDGLGKIEEAIKDYGRVLGLSPKFADARFKRGVAFEKIGRVDDALQEYDRAIQLEPTFPDPYYQHARILFEKGEFARVIRDVETLTNLVPDDGLPHHVKAACLLNLEEYEDANISATQAIERDDNNAESWYFRAFARFYNGDTIGALEDLKHAFQLNPSDPRLQELQDQIQQAGQQ
jgi:tetratricopeptide (TPR) repeat protein